MYMMENAIHVVTRDKKLMEKPLKKRNQASTIKEAIEKGAPVEIDLKSFFKERRKLSKQAES